MTSGLTAYVRLGLGVLHGPDEDKIAAHCFKGLDKPYKRPDIDATDAARVKREFATNGYQTDHEDYLALHHALAKSGRSTNESTRICRISLIISECS